uniref:Arachidonate 5-lipoxygenase-activating protein n=1 Tax=Haplochromis burtoni TaxID=8153 RepID=A0A3Q2VE18_HAPBU
MDSNKVVENIYLLVIVTLVSVLQNAFFAQKVERECKNHNTRTSAFERVSCANRNCMDAYPTFLAVMWCAGLCLSQEPSGITLVGYLTSLVGRIGRLHLNWLISWHHPGLGYRVEVRAVSLFNVSHLANTHRNQFRCVFVIVVLFKHLTVFQQLCFNKF